MTRRIACVTLHSWIRSLRIKLSYECHSLIQDNVFHIFTLTAPSNDTWECLFCSVCAFQLLTYYAMIKCYHIFTPCSFATAITYNTDNVSHQTSLNHSSDTIPLSSPYIWLHTVSMNPVTTSMSGLLSLKVLLKRPVGLGSTTLTYNAKNLYKNSRKHALSQEEVVCGETTCKTLTRLNNNTLKVVCSICDEGTCRIPDH